MTTPISRDSRHRAGRNLLDLSPSTNPKKAPLIGGISRQVSDGIRTHDRLDHNQELYQLSYAHRGRLNLALRRICDRTSSTIGALTR